MSRIKLLIKNVGQPCHEATIEGNILNELQQIVGGWIEAYQFNQREPEIPDYICCICNEDGALKKLPPNIYDFVGNLAIVKRGAEDFESLSEEDIALCKSILDKAEPDKPQLFSLGVCTATRGAGDTLESHQMMNMLKRHSTGDFGELCEEDIKVNMDSIKYGARVLSKYTVNGNEYYVITEADRTVTTILLTDEY